MHIHRPHRFGVKIKTLMAITAVFAMAFYAIEEWGRVSPERRWELERKWVRIPLDARFLPAEGAAVRLGDPLLKVAWIISRNEGHSWLVTEGGKIGDTWHHHWDAGGDSNLGVAPAEGLAELPAYLKRLPPSDLAAPTSDCLMIAFPSGGAWVVRRYRHDSLPKEANDIATLLNFRSSYDGQLIDHW